LWIPPGLGTGALEISDDRQKTFIADLQTKVMPGAELLQTSIEDLKTRIMEKLNPEAGAFKPKPRHSSLTQVYLICEHLDRASVRPLKEYLFKLKFEVITWLDQGSDKLMEYHHKNLRDCDAALIYFGNGDEPWVRKNLEDLEKGLRLRARNGLAGKCGVCRRGRATNRRKTFSRTWFLTSFVISRRLIRMTCASLSAPCSREREGIDMGEAKTFTNPFPGLRPFETNEYRLFFGREGQSDELIRRLQRSRFLAVVGTSGSGKSSLVRAGLLPALLGGMMAEGRFPLARLYYATRQRSFR
jgi:hypothetical protein